MSSPEDKGEIEYVQVPRYKLLAWLEEIRELRRLASERTPSRPSQD